MASPWEKYGQQAPAPAASDGPWQKYGEPPAGDLPWYGEEPGIAAKLLESGKQLVTGIDDVMSGRVDPKSDQGIANITNAAMVASPVSAATRGGLGWMGAKVTPKTTAAAPTGVELKGIGGAGFDMARTMDVRYKPAAVQNMAMRVQSRLFKDGYRDRAESASETFAEIRDILKSGEPGAFVTIDDLHAIRQSLGNTAQNFNKPTDQKAAVILIKEIDDFIANADPASVVAGPAAEAGRVWSDAMGNYAAGSKSNKLKGLEDDAELQAIATNSGLNVDNKLRQLAALIVRKPTLSSGFTEAEIGQLRAVAGEGAKARNALRWFANVLGGGGGLGALVTGLGGAAVTGMGAPAVIGAGAIGTGLAAKVAANKITRGKMGRVDEAVRQRSPFYQEQVATSPVKPTAPGTVKMLAPRGIGGLVTQPPQPMTPAQVEEYLRQKRLFEQGA